MKTELYIHIPFCVKKCNYCDFLSYAADEATREEYVKALIQQIKLISLSDNYDRDIVVSSVYVGGGTPSILNVSQIHDIMSTIDKSFNMASDAERTIEVNPGTVDLCKLKAIKDAGFNRLSIGMQSSDNVMLERLGRIHSYEEFSECYVNSREAGFGNINIDVMTGLPGQSKTELMSTMERVIELSPEHISAYSLIIEEGTAFYDLYGDIEGPVVGEQLEREMYWECTDRLIKAGYEHYEISNYAKPGYYSRHNCGYWKRIPYIGAGLGASSLICIPSGKEKRIQNTTKMSEYLTNPMSICEETELTAEDAMDEYAFLGLRMKEGINLKEFERIYGIDFTKRYSKSIRKYTDEGLIEFTENRVKLTRKGVDYGNYVFSGFMGDF